MIDEDVASQITIYNSGASAHKSPNQGRFTDLRSIKPKTVKAADKTIFLVTGVGCMKINIPNGKDNTSVMLKDKLYCPELGCTLVSLAKCDTANFMILLKDKTFYIKDPKGTQISRTPQYQGLYQVDDHGAANRSAYIEVRVHTVNELHRKRGHISPMAIKTTSGTENYTGTVIRHET